MTCREDGTYNIEFDDKEIFKEFKVPVTRIRKVSQKHGIKREMSEEARECGSGRKGSLCLIFRMLV